MFFDFLLAMLLPEYLNNSNSSIVSGDENDDDNDVGDYDGDYDDAMRMTMMVLMIMWRRRRRRNWMIVTMILTFCPPCAPFRRNR